MLTLLFLNVLSVLIAFCVSFYLLKQKIFEDVELKSKLNQYLFSVTFCACVLLFQMFLFEITALGTEQ